MSDSIFDPIPRFGVLSSGTEEHVERSWQLSHGHHLSLLLSSHRPSHPPLLNIQSQVAAEIVAAEDSGGFSVCRTPVGATAGPLDERDPDLAPAPGASSD